VCADDFRVYIRLPAHRGRISEALGDMTDGAHQLTIRLSRRARCSFRRKRMRSEHGASPCSKVLRRERFASDVPEICVHVPRGHRLSLPRAVKILKQVLAWHIATPPNHAREMSIAKRHRVGSAALSAELEPQMLTNDLDVLVAKRCQAEG